MNSAQDYPVERPKLGRQSSDEKAQEQAYKLSIQSNAQQSSSGHRHFLPTESLDPPILLQEENEIEQQDQRLQLSRIFSLTLAEPGRLPQQTDPSHGGIRPPDEANSRDRGHEVRSSTPVIGTQGNQRRRVTGVLWSPTTPIVAIRSDEAPRLLSAARDLPDDPTHSSSFLPTAKSVGWWKWTSASCNTLELARDYRALVDFPQSPFVPTNERQWLEQRIWWLEFRIDHLNKAMNALVEHKLYLLSEKNAGRIRRPPPQVSCQLSVWSPKHIPAWTKIRMGQIAPANCDLTLACSLCKKAMADWPRPDEQLEEGDRRRYAHDRNNFQRMLPLPRYSFRSQAAPRSGQPRQHWNICAIIPPTSYDSVNGLAARMGHVEHDSESVDNAELEALLDWDLMGALNA